MSLRLNEGRQAKGSQVERRSQTKFLRKFVSWIVSACFQRRATNPRAPETAEAQTTQGYFDHIFHNDISNAQNATVEKRERKRGKSIYSVLETSPPPPPPPLFVTAWIQTQFKASV